MQVLAQRINYGIDMMYWSVLTTVAQLLAVGSVLRGARIGRRRWFHGTTILRMGIRKKATMAVSWTDTCVEREIREIATIEETRLVRGDAIADGLINCW